MADEEVVIVDPQGTEHVFPAGFDPAKAAAIVRNSLPLKEPTTFGEGFTQSLKKTASDTGTGILQGAKNAINPRNILSGLRDTASVLGDPSAILRAGYEQGRAGLPGLRTLSQPQEGGQAIGGLLTALAVPAAMKGTSAALRWAAPQAMDMGLQRTMADRLEFPNTPQRLVDEAIIPHGQNVQNALTATEQGVNAKTAAWDAAHPNPHMIAVKGAQPPQMADQAAGFAVNEGKVAGLGNVPGPEDAEIARIKDQYLSQNTRPRNLSETVEQKRSYQSRARYNNRPNAPTQTNNELNFNKGIAAANRTEAIRMEPSIGPDLAKEQDLLGALSAVQKMGAKSTPLSTIGTAKTLLGLRNPTIMGSSAIALDRTGQALQGLSPELVRAALLDLMRSHQPEQ